MTVRYLPPRIDTEDALKRFNRRRWGNLFGLLKPRPARVDESGHPISIEMVWLPLYGYQFSLSHRGKQIQSWVSVDASFGGFALFGRVTDIAEGDPDGERFLPVISRDDAESLAREGVVRYILRKRGAKPSVDAITGTMDFLTPVWVYYSRTMGGSMDLAVLDAYSGDPMGGLVRRAIVDGFIAKSRTRSSGTADP